jgi:hypothetical protein
MKLFVVLAFLFVCTSAVHVCFPEEFTTHQSTWIPEREDRFGSKVFFSRRANKQRVDIDGVFTDGKPQKERFSYLFDYPNSKYYAIHYDLVNHNSSCTVHPLTGKLETICLSKNAQHRGKLSLAAVLHCNNYVEHVKDEKGERVMIDILVASDINVPIRSFSRRGSVSSHRITVDEWWDFQEKVQHEAFNVPTVCSGQETSIEKPKTFNQVVSSAHPLVGDSIMF